MPEPGDCLRAWDPTVRNTLRRHTGARRVQGGVDMTSRRSFIQWIPIAGAAIAAGARAQQPMVNEKDPQAVALGYVADAKGVDKAKFPKYAPPQHCANCQLYQGAATAPDAPCAIFAGKRVPATGWCNAWVVKPGS
jgi:hypothetical protein